VAGPIDELRTLAADAPQPAPVLETYVAAVRERAYSVTDDQVEELKRAGVTEDEIFEATVDAAVGEGLRRLDAALRVLG
jgi:alkylhydroperoxidase family enzyme